MLDLGPEAVAAVAVVDLQGSPLSELSLLAGEDYPQRFNFAVAPSGDGWLVAFGYNHPSTGSRGILVSKVSQGAGVGKQLDIKVGGYVSLNGFAAGEDGDVILDGDYDSGGQFSTSYEIVLHLDRELETASCAEAQVD